MVSAVSGKRGKRYLKRQQLLELGEPALRYLTEIARQGEQRKLRRRRLTVFGRLGAAAHEHDPLPVRRPARLGIALACRQAHRSVGACGRNHPQHGVVIVFLLVDRDAHKHHVRAVGRGLRVANPLKAEDVFVADKPLGLSGN